MKYTERVMSIVKDAMRQQDSLNRQIAELEAQYMQYEAISGQEFRERMDDLHRQQTTVLANASQQLQEVNSQYVATVEKSEDAQTMEEKIRQFEEYITAANNTLRYPQGLQAVLFNDGKLTPQCCTENE